MIKAVIFDLDGVLIDSGSFWDEAEATVLSKVGVPFSLELARETIGLRTDELVDYWYSKYPWQAPTRGQVGKLIDSTVVKLIRAKGVPKLGVYKALALCDQLDLPIGIASSSSMDILEAALEALGITHKFSVVHSAELEAAGKPDPAVYLTASRKLGIEPGSCLALEDSINGVTAAKAAGLQCIAIPVADNRLDSRFADIADEVISSLDELNETIIKGLSHLQSS